MTKFCERLRDLRKENGLSKLQLSKQLGVSQSTVSRWENEKIIPTIESLDMLCNYFKVPADYLLGRTDIY